ncbi:MAG: DUF937 domain-containing protein [Saprospiraceae bacterium]|nr:DUF937 domain-containing protein [Saprospiraceae bacterium]
MNILDLLQGQMSEGLVDQLSQQLGADKSQTTAAASGIFSTLMGALARNAADPKGAESLNNALDRDHDGSILDNLGGFLGGQTQPSNNNMMNGAGILKHILGGKQSGAIDMISQMSGLDSSKTGSLMSMLAPMVLGTLGRQKKTQGLDVSGLAGMLTETVSASKERPEMGLVGKLLDRDGDGSIMDDVAGIGMNIFSKFLRR